MLSTAAAIAAAAIVVLAIVLVAMAYERKSKSDMTAVYGRSFSELPHAPLRARPRAAGLGLARRPGFEFHQQPVMGGSFAHLV